MPEHPHLLALHLALAEAGAWEHDELARLAKLSLSERIHAGVSWPPMLVEDCAWAGRSHSLITVRAPSGVDLHENISPGDRVVVRICEQPYSGVVREVDQRAAEIRVQGEPPVDMRAVVTKSFDPTTWRRYADALARADGHQSHLRDVLLGEREPSPPRSNFDVQLSPHLNESQQAAARLALDSEEVALVHGPPGTGKTLLLVELLTVLVRQGDRPWALADSNAATDHLAVRAHAAGLKVVRVGHIGRMSADARKLSLQEVIRKGPYGSAIAKLDREFVRAGHDGRADSWRIRKSLRKELVELRELAEAAALEQAQVLAMTLGTLAWRGPTLPAPRTAVIDEATQAVEPAVWTAVPFVQRLILVGDPHQLGPVVKMPGNALERSLLERLLDPDDPAGARLPLPMLSIQHRMHHHIQHLVSPTYGQAYTPHDSVKNHLLHDLPYVATTELTARSTLWIDTAGANLEEQVDPATRSLHNPGEAAVVLRVVAHLVAAGVKPEDIGIIAPYSAQVRELRTQPDLLQIEIASVNAFQGREKEVIICTWVRSNSDGSLGFVADGRRLTVALTRARRLLVAIGDSSTLSWYAGFAAVFEFFEEQDAWQTVWDEAWSE
ncbi:MAG: ATP-dependent RNA/DNA helicase IGHMBP2 [Kiritimatiellia bacterium]|jgi:ATP-dependent RNA/DNA helicase IGHMBP2